MAEPYGLMYGLGAGLSQVPKAYLEGQRFATQQQAAEMQNEAMQRKLAEDAAFNQAAAQPMPADFMGQASWYESMAQAPGLAGEQRMKAIEQANKLRQMGKAEMGQQAARMLFSASKPEDLVMANQTLKKAGWDFGDVTIDPQDPSNFVLGGGMKLRREDAAAIAGMPLPEALKYLTGSEKMLKDQIAKQEKIKSTEKIAGENNATRIKIAEMRLAQMAKKAGVSGQKLTAKLQEAQALARSRSQRDGISYDQAYADALEQVMTPAGIRTYQAKEPERLINWDIKLTGLEETAGPEKVAPIRERIQQRSANTGGLRIGMIEGGYKYVGGDPNSQSSWQKVK